MTAKEYIEYKLNELKPDSPVTVEDFPDFIFKALMSKKFRKFSVIPDYQEHIKEAIKNSIKSNLPIKLCFPFGGYKLWRFEETPEVDWAELFTLMYYAKWLKPIADVYKPGVVLDFASDDVIVEQMNNIPKESTKAYMESFNRTVKFLEKYIPQNLKFTFTPVGSFYTSEEFQKDLQDKIEQKQKEFGGLPQLDERKKEMTELNVKLKPGQDEDPLWREKVELVHQAYMSVDKRRPYNRAVDKILVFTYKLRDGKCIPVGTTKNSVAKFWVGLGALEKREDSFLETVLAPSQLENSKYAWEPISIEGLIGKNFNKIRVLDKN